MTYVIALLILLIGAAGMAIGLILKKKTLKRGCSMDPDECTCLKNNIDPADCPEPNKADREWQLADSEKNQ